MLKVENLTVYYGKALAVKDVAIRVERGEIVAIVGSNGAGKTTILNAVMGVVKKSGKVLFENADITNFRTHEIANLGISYLPDTRTVFKDLTVLDNLRVAFYKNLKHEGENGFRQKLEGIFEHFTNLEEKIKLKAGFLSGGEQQMLSIAQSLIREPKLVVLDEPSAGLSPKLVKDLFNIISFMKKNKLTVLLVEQNVNKTIKVADRVYFLKNGKIVASGRAEDFQDENVIKQAYFGG